MIDERFGFDGAEVRIADWNQIHSGKEFAQFYMKTSERRLSLKGQIRGEALARYAIANPINPQTGGRRTFLKTAAAAAWGGYSHYNSRKADFTFDPNTFEAKCW